MKTSTLTSQKMTLKFWKKIKSIIKRNWKFQHSYKQQKFIIKTLWEESQKIKKKQSFQKQ